MEALAEPVWHFAENQQFLFEPHRYKIGYGGRVGTKSWGFARALLVQGFEKRLRILCAREVQKSIKDSVHQLLEDQIERMQLSGFYRVLRDEIRGLNGTSVVYTGLSDLTVEQIKSYEGIDICWVEEAAKVTRRSWDILIPTIRKEGSEIWITLNPELDTDETWLRFVANPPHNAFIQEMSYHTNPWMSAEAEEERQDFLRLVEAGVRSQEDYDNIWEGKTKTAVEGAIFANQVAKVIKDNRLTHVPHDPKLLTHLIWDLGYSDNMVIGFVQRAGPSLRFIDYIEDHHRTYEEYVQQIRGMVDEHGYRIALDGRSGGKAWLPHDGKAKNPQTGKSPIETLNDLGLKADEEGIPDIGIKARIEAGRQMFVRVLFDKEKCTPLFNRLRRYARRISKETGQPTGIKKDGNDHAGDMYCYTAVIESELGNELNKPKKKSYDNRGVV